MKNHFPTDTHRFVIYMLEQSNDFLHCQIPIRLDCLPDFVFKLTEFE